MAFLNSLNEKAFTFDDDNISPSDLGVGRDSILVLSLYELVRLERAEGLLVLLAILEGPKNGTKGSKKKRCQRYI